MNTHTYTYTDLLFLFVLSINTSRRRHDGAVVGSESVSGEVSALNPGQRRHQYAMICSLPRPAQLPSLMLCQTQPAGGSLERTLDINALPFFFQVMKC